MITPLALLYLISLALFVEGMARAPEGPSTRGSKPASPTPLKETLSGCTNPLRTKAKARAAA